MMQVRKKSVTYCKPQDTLDRASPANQVYPLTRNIQKNRTSYMRNGSSPFAELLPFAC